MKYNNPVIKGFYPDPSVCKVEDTYYMVTSGCTCWEANSALYSKSPDIMSDWRLIENPCVGEN